MDDALLSDRNPLPAGIPVRLLEQLTFVIEVDRLKTVLRQSPLAAADRRENDAEHSWHLALMVVLLAEYADEPFDVGRAIQLVIVHDLVEIHAGDTPLYDTAGAATQIAREQEAATRLFGLLPADQATALRALWDEFEARQTPEARFAKAMDRLQPVLLNWMARGGTWNWPGVTADTIRARTTAIADASQALGDVEELIIADGVRHGWIRPPADVTPGGQPG